jgi:hypothetical protein
LSVLTIALHPSDLLPSPEAGDHEATEVKLNSNEHQMSLKEFVIFANF